MNPSLYRVANFKAFGPEPREIPLRPITLIFGQNSAGKSSVLHSLLWLNHLLETGESDVRFPRASGRSIDLGGFGQVLFRHSQSARVMTELVFPKTRLATELLGFFRVEREASIDLSFGTGPGSSKALLLDYRLKIDGRDLLTAIRKQDGFVISSVDLEHPAIEGRALQLSTHKSHTVPNLGVLIASLTKSKDLGVDETVDRMVGLAREMNESDAIIQSLTDTITGRYTLRLDGALPGSLTCDSPGTGDEFWDLILPARLDALVRNLRALAMATMDGLRYVPPLRELPPRFFDLGEADSIWQRLFEDPSLLTRVNHWLKSDAFRTTKYELVIAEYFSRAALERELPSVLQREFARAVLTEEDDAEPFPDDLTAVIDELKEKFFRSNLDDFLAANQDIRDAIAYNESDAREFVGESYEYHLEPTGRSIDELTTEEWEQLVQEHLNWEAYINPDSLEQGERWVTDLFQRWAVQQPQLLELFDRHGDPSTAITRNLGNSSFERREIRREILLRQIREKTQVSLQDVGVGISQVLPVLLQAYGQHECFIAIEQPEIHIHPALQAELGDVFIESALGENKNTFLLETHSEHLILRLLRRIRETTRGRFNDWPESLKKACPNGIRPEDIAVLYVQPGEEGAVIRELRIDAQGKFLDSWPDGFFEESFNEMF